MYKHLKRYLKTHNVDNDFTSSNKMIFLSKYQSITSRFKSNNILIDFEIIQIKYNLFNSYFKIKRLFKFIFFSYFQCSFLSFKFKLPNKMF